MSIQQKKILVITSVSEHIVVSTLQWFYWLISGLGILLISSAASAADGLEESSQKIKNLGDYTIQLVCDPHYNENDSEQCEIVITNPNSLDQSKATLILPHNEFSNITTLDSDRNLLEPSSLFSSETLDKKEKSPEYMSHKYRISRDWLFQMKITEDSKEPDISILSIIVPNDDNQK